MENFRFDDTSLKIRVDFLDGEVMYGMTNGYSPNRKGFFISPRKENQQRESLCHQGIYPRPESLE